MLLAQVIAAALFARESGPRAAQVFDEHPVGLVVSLAAVTQHRRRVHRRNHGGLRRQAEVGGFGQPQWLTTLGRHPKCRSHQGLRGGGA